MNVKLAVNTTSQRGLIRKSPEIFSIKVRKEEGETSDLSASSCFQRGDRVSTHGLGRASTWRYLPSHHGQPQMSAFAEDRLLRDPGTVTLQTLTTVDNRVCVYTEDVHFWEIRYTLRGDDRSFFVSYTSHTHTQWNNFLAVQWYLS